MADAQQTDRIYIRDASELINRRMDTIRKWEGKGVLPKKLRPKRENNGRMQRYWTMAQIEGIKKWLKDTDRRPGKGLPSYNPTPDQVDKQLEALRGERIKKTSS